MKFVNRVNELKIIKEASQLSKNKLYTIVITGLRRIGKTRLILESIGKQDLYFFINKDKTKEDLLKEFEGELKKRGIIEEYVFFRQFSDFLDVIIKKYQGIVVFDEFQNFKEIDKAIFGEMQKMIDLNENKKGLLFIFSGSFIGLIKKLLSRKQPLYGRIKREIKLKPLKIYDSIKLCNEAKVHSFEDIVRLYFIFEGFPKYYVSIEDENLKAKNFWEVMERFFFVSDAIFEDEVSKILSLEFGKRKGVYYVILEAIANGENTLSKIASYLNRKETSITRHINELVNLFYLIEQEKTVIGKKKVFVISHPLMNFWFRFFYKNLSSYKRRDEEFIKYVKSNMNAFMGIRFEKLGREFVLNNFDFSKVGRQWGKIPEALSGENQYEIDIVALKEKEILFGECKWKEKVNGLRIVSELSKKAEYVDYVGERSYCVFAKSFSKRIEEFEGCKVYCYSLEDIRKVYK